MGYGHANIVPIQMSSNGMAYRLEKVSDTKQYHGYAKAGTLTSDTTDWMIQEVTVDAGGDITAIKYPNGSANFTYEWDERASYTYA